MTDKEKKITTKKSYSVETIRSKIREISTLDEENLQHYLDTEELALLHAIKLYADDLYYNTGDDSGFDDYQYDLLKETLDRRDPTYTVPIGARIREGENRVKLDYWLGSMDKYKPEDSKEIEKWVKKNKGPYIIESKLDGVSCLLMIRDGKKRLYTRGDGEVGADISYLAQYFSSIPNVGEGVESLDVRGELIIEEEKFKRRYSKRYKNPRNMVSGLINAKTIREGVKDIDFVAYEVLGEKRVSSPSAQLDYLNSLGFQTVMRERVTSISPSSLSDTLIRFKEREKYEIDGIIVQRDAPYIRNKSGNPKYAFAYKMRLGDDVVETEVKGVEWNVSKWGQLKPRVRIDPVELSGVTITWATGFNGKFIKDNKVGEGAIIKITRSGDVIPFIVSVVKGSNSGKGDMPEIPYKWKESGVDIYTEEYGETMCIKMISAFFQKLGIKHVSTATVEKMYKGGLNTLLKIISAEKSDLARIESFKEKSVDRIHKNIREGMNGVKVTLVLGASGVFGYGIGVRKVEELFKAIPGILEEYLFVEKDDLLEMVMGVEGFSEKTGQKIVDNIEWADKLITELEPYSTFVWPRRKEGRGERVGKGDEEKTTTTSSAPPLPSLEGMKFVLSGFRDKDLSEKIEERGGKVTSSVSKKTTGVIVKEKGGKLTGKPAKAESLGVRVYSREEFEREVLGE